jgi:hypothetical protein
VSPGDTSRCPSTFNFIRLVQRQAERVGVAVAPARGGLDVDAHVGALRGQAPARQPSDPPRGCSNAALRPAPVARTDVVLLYRREAARSEAVRAVVRLAIEVMRENAHRFASVR